MKSINHFSIRTFVVLFSVFEVMTWRVGVMNNRHNMWSSFFVLVSLIHSLFSSHAHICSSPTKARITKSVIFYGGSQNTPNSILGRWHLQDQPSSPLRQPSQVMQSRVREQASLVIPWILEKMLNFVNLFFFWVLAFLITYLFTHWYH